MSIKKVLDNGNLIKYKIKFIDSFRFMSGSLSVLVDKLSEELHNNKFTNCISCHDYIYQSKMIIRYLVVLSKKRIIRRTLIKI